MFSNIKQKLEGHNVFKKVAKNSSWIVFQNIFTMILGVVITGVIARYFGTEKYGIFNYILSITSLFSGIASIGIYHIATKDLTQRPEDEGKILGTSFTIRLIAAILLIIAAETTVCIMTNNDSTSMVIGILLSLMMLFSCSEVIDYYATANLKVKYLAVSKCISYIIFAVLKILIVVLKLDIRYYTATYLIEGIIYAIFLSISYKLIHKNIGKTCKWSFDKDYAKKLLSNCWYFALSSIMVTIYMRIDQVMLGKMIEDKSQVGIYSAAVRIAEMWAFVPNSIISSFKPVIMKYKGENNNKEYVKNLQRLYDISSLVSILFAIGITIFARLIIMILYGKAFLEASKILYILIWGIWFGILGNVHYVWLICENKGKYSLFYSATGSISNIIFNAILIPKYGMYGAAIATLISQFIANIVSFGIFKETRVLSKFAIKAILFVEPLKFLKNRIKGVKYAE
jgi:O-antigen/teichoic acid export membrane protein